MGDTSIMLPMAHGKEMACEGESVFYSQPGKYEISEWMTSNLLLRPPMKSAGSTKMVKRSAWTLP
ncbi:hypothetical protein D3C77_478210 [compost metagenome]